VNNLFYDIVKIAKKESGNNLHTINDLFYVCKNTIDEGNVKEGLHLCKELKKLLGQFIQNETNTHKEEIYYKIFDVLVLESPYSLDSYFQALEYNRPVEEQFYLPRRNTLIKHGVIQALEDLMINDVIDELFLSMPPRVGKTTLAVFVVSWVLGYASDKSNLYSSHGGKVTQAFYDGVATLLGDDYTYNWTKIFPNVQFNKSTMCNAKDTYLDTGRKKRYHSFTARSIDSALNGACDCNGLLLGDDLVEGIEEALNLARLRSKWLKVSSDLLTRAKERAKKFWIGTRWSINDPIGIMLEENEGNVRRRNIVIPALDDNDQSNFDYLYGVGFSTEYYKQRRASFEKNDDMATWYAVFQGKPIEREGMLFNPSQLMYFNGVLPEGEPTRKFAYVDVGWGGGDYTAMPVIYQYDKDLFCVDFICDSGNKKITQPRVVDMIMKHGLSSVKFEKNNGGEGYKDDIERALKEKNIKINLLTSYASNQITKETKIFEHAPSIRDIYFLEEGKRNVDYVKAMENLCAFTIRGKNRHDDVPDALAGIIDMVNEVVQKTSIKIFQRIF